VSLNKWFPVGIETPATVLLKVLRKKINAGTTEMREHKDYS